MTPEQRMPENANGNIEHLTTCSQTNIPEPIAIIGASCRLPGSASNLQKFWELLRDRKSAWSSFPGSRFNQQGFHDAKGGGKRGTTYTAGGHFVKYDVAAFDSSFFGMHPNEVKVMDPQHRLLLEIAYETFENAGFTLDDISDSSTGVYVGQWTSDYHDILTRDHDSTPTYLALGTGPAISSNRISYFFNLKGPSFTLDTGCSASLVALHQAIQGLRAGDAEQSFVAGVNLTLDPHRYSYMSQVKMFSKEGKSFPFDGRATGYGRGEGCSGVILQPLSLALKQGRHIRAIIRNSACNQDGRTAGITVPSSSAQIAAIKKAYADAGLILYADYVEAHGTGTQVGDPIEAKAISATLAENRGFDSPLPIGSVKGNIGHLESAAGVTSLLKALLMLENNEIPPQMNSEERNPAIVLKKLNLRVPLEAERGGLNRISINCFGYGGTNAHVILDSASTYQIVHNKTGNLKNGATGNENDLDGPASINKTTRRKLFVISAATEKSCQSMAANLAGYLESKSTIANLEEDILNNLALTLSHRTVFSHRIGFISSTLNGLAEQMRMSNSQPIPFREGKAPLGIAFVFSGQGAQYPLMAQELLGKWQAFTDSLERANICVAQCGSTWNLIEELLKSKETSRIETPELAQPITTAIQLALVDTFRDLGVTPTVVAGHSSGEIAAAYCAGKLSLADAITVSFHRGRLASILVRKTEGDAGSMLAVGSSPDTVQKAIQSLGDFQSRLQIACYNSPSSVTVSGDNNAVEMLQAMMEKEEIFNRKLRTYNVAYHSHHMTAIADEYRAAIAGIKPNTEETSISMISSLTGEEIGESLLDKDYWVQNMLSPVRFSDAVTKICMAKSKSKKIGLFLEIGPHFQLVGPVKQTIQSLGHSVSKIQCIGCLKRGEDAEIRLLDTLRSLWIEKYPINLDRVNASSTKTPKLLIDLPPYPFDHSKTFWHESRASKKYRNREDLPHELLGIISSENNPMEPQWRLCLNLDDLPWLKGHKVQGEVVFPAAAFIAMAIQAAEQDIHHKNKEAVIKQFQLRNFCIEKALVLNSANSDLELFLNFRPQTYSARSSSNIWKEFRIFSVSGNDTWSEHCRGLIHTFIGDDTKVSTPNNSVNFDRIGQTIKPEKLYFLSKDAGLDWTAPFDSLTDLKTCGGAAISTVTSSKIKDISYGPNGLMYIIHPALLDSCLFQGIAAILLLEDNVKMAFVPTFIKSLSIVVPQDGLVKNITCLTKRVGGYLSFDFSAFDKDSDEKIIIQAQGVKVTQLPNFIVGASNSRELCHSIEWVTYLPALSKDWLQDACNSSVKKSFVLDQWRSVSALALSYIKPVLASVSREEIPDNHLRYWYDSLKAQSGTEYDPDDLRIGFMDESILGQIINQTGPHLTEILLGSMHMHTLFTGNENLIQLYKNEEWDRCYNQISKFCRELGRQNPNLKILEVGANTASLSQSLLTSLSISGRIPVAKYQFTDISSNFFQAAQDKLSNFKDVVHYQKLDIGKDPTSQGFDSHEYDLVIAVDVIHTTSSLDQSLHNIRTLLKAGGNFILAETTKDMIPLNLAFGASSDWWAGYEEGRTHSPFISEGEWSRKLKRNGFSQTEPCGRGSELDDGGFQCMFIATADSPLRTQPTPALDIITSSQESRASEFAHQLKQIMGNNEIALHELSSPVGDVKVSVILPDVTNRLCGIDAQHFEFLKQRIIRSEAILFITCDGIESSEIPNSTWVPGFCRSLRLEHPDIRIVELRIEGQLDSSKIDAIVTIIQSPSMSLDSPSTQVELEFLLRDNQLYIPRAVHQQEMSDYIHQSHGSLETVQDQFISDRTLVAELETPNLIETIRWIDDPSVDAPLHPDYIKLCLNAASINFKDVLIAAGYLEGMTKLLNDCSGIVIEVGENMKHRYSVGERVCAVNAKSYTNYPVVHGDCSIRIPDDMDFETGASIPTVWATALHGLVDRGRLQKGEKVLIHSAAGAVGQAAVMIAQHLGAEVFATCGSDEKKEILMHTFGIPKDHIFSSRSTAFQDEIMSFTSDQGVDVVLNSLSEDLLRVSCNVLTYFGRFVEIGRKDMMEDALLPLEFMLNNITFSYIDLHQVFISQPQIIQRLLQSIMNLFTTGSVKSVMLTRMPISDISSGFRLLQSGKNIGKIVLTVKPDQQVKVVRPRPRLPVLKPDVTYIITGGLGGLGKRIVCWLAERGARNIVTMSRSGVIDDTAKTVLDKLKSDGVNVAVKRCNIASEDALKLTLSEVRRDMPPIRGVIQSAMVTQDSLFVDMTATQWAQAMSPKALGTWNLHTILPTDLDFFIFLSSGVAITGNIGQCNYAAGCSFQDGLAHYRTGLGLVAHSINVGAITDAGYVSENPDVAASLRRQGLGTINFSEFLSHLDQILGKEGYRSETGRSLPCQSIIGLLPSGNELGLRRGLWINDKKFIHIDKQMTNLSQDSNSNADVGAALSSTKTLEEAVDTATGAIIKQLGKLISMPSDSISAAKSLDSYGIDSLITVELRNWISASLKANISLLVIRDTASITELGRLVVKESKLINDAIRSPTRT